MATDITYINYVCDALSGIGEITFKKMFGEYMVYLNGKPVVIVCDNTAFVKKLPVIEGLVDEKECGYPYEGAKEHYILNVDDCELAKKIVIEIEKVTPLPKKRAKKATK